MKTSYKLLFGLLGGFLFAASPLHAQCLSAWDYSKPITVTNPTGSDMHNYQTKITVNTAALVAAGKLQASGNDLRFYGTDCCNFLCYYVQDGMNTATTNIWVKVPFIPASGTATIKMAYGNPAATNGESADCTFDMWEPFDSPVNHFTADVCGSGGYSVAGGIANINWPGAHMLTSDVTFDLDTVYRAETNITAASGNWPGIYWLKSSGNNEGYGTLLGGGNIRISKTGTSSGYCQGHNWASALYPYGPVNGLWSITWIGTGDMIGEIPGVPMTATDNQFLRDADMKVCLGGISSGSGSMDVDWVRVRKYSSAEPTFGLGAEGPLSNTAVSVSNDTSVCAGSTVVLTASAGFLSYTWNTGATTQSISINTPGTYIVEASDGSCPSYDTVVVTTQPAPAVDLGANFNVCAGGTTVLDAGAGAGYTYDWSNAATTQTVTVGPGTYSVIVENANGCSDADTIIVGTSPTPVASFTQAIAGLTVTFDNTSTGGTDYNWNFGDGDSSSTFEPVHVFSTPGTYNVCLTVSNGGCETTVCINILVTNTGLASNFDEAGISMFPNPAGEICWIQLPASIEHAAVSIIDITGKSILATQDNKSGLVQLDLSGLAAGIYQVNITNGNNTYSSKLIVK